MSKCQPHNSARNIISDWYIAEYLLDTLIWHRALLEENSGRRKTILHQYCIQINNQLL